MTASPAEAQIRAAEQQHEAIQQAWRRVLPSPDAAHASASETVSAIRILFEAGVMPTVEPILPAILTLKGKPYTLQDHFAFSPLFTTRLPKRRLFCTGRQVAKCGRPHSNYVYDEFGRRVRLGDVQVGDQILAVDPTTLMPALRHVIARHLMPDKPCLQLTTGSGVILEVAETHPLLTAYGWTPAASLTPGERIAHVATGGYFGDCTATADEIRVAADSGRVPAWVFQLSKQQTANFISQLWADDLTQPLSTSYTTTSQQTAFELKSLLLKFGIAAVIARDATSRKYRVRIDAEYKRFIQMFGRDGCTDTRDTAPQDVVCWDTIIASEPQGKQPCCDIEVEDLHTYVLDGIISHNSTSVSAAGVILANWIPNFTQLYITPLYEQVRRLSGNFVRPFIDNSPVRQLWTGTRLQHSVLQRSFLNESMLQFSFAGLDAGRVRGTTADAINYDETQDLRDEHFPIVREVISHSEWGLEQWTGTPKSLDNIMETLWRKSSQAEWWVPCLHCGKWNIPCREYHLEAMLGPVHRNISEKCPATVCYACRKPVNPRHGRWHHRVRERRWTFPGYHVPQIIMPIHYTRRMKWAELLGKCEGWSATSPATIWNEVFGESYDEGAKLLTVTELKAAACLSWKNNWRDPTRQLQQAKRYEMLALAIDWGGGGEDRVSLTSIALLGHRPSGRVDVIWGKRLLTPNDHLREAREVLYWVKYFHPTLIAHDYSGAGTLRETLLVQSGKISPERIMPMAYVGSAKGKILSFVEATLHHNRSYYRLDKSRALIYVITAMKLGIMRTFQYDHVSDDRPGLLQDFLALIEEKSESRVGDIYFVRRQQGRSDDFAQAATMGACALWHSNDSWPDFHAATMSRFNLTADQVQAIGDSTHGWETDPDTLDAEGLTE